jgi:hypothetical protein
VKHAGPPTLSSIEPLLERLRAVDGLVEQRPGVFYRRSKACLHFHEDGAVVYADLRLAPTGAFVRRRVTTKAEQRGLIRDLRATHG